jgi:hypothetical protein
LQYYQCFGTGRHEGALAAAIFACINRSGKHTFPILNKNQGSTVSLLVNQKEVKVCQLSGQEVYLLPRQTNLRRTLLGIRKRG